MNSLQLLFSRRDSVMAKTAKAGLMDKARKFADDLVGGPNRRIWPEIEQKAKSLAKRKAEELAVPQLRAPKAPEKLTGGGYRSNSSAPKQTYFAPENVRARHDAEVDRLTKEYADRWYNSKIDTANARSIAAGALGAGGLALLGARKLMKKPTIASRAERYIPKIVRDNKMAFGATGLGIAGLAAASRE